MKLDVTTVVFYRRSLWHLYWPVLLILGLWLWLFWPFLTGQEVAGFRDSAYLYYPLFQFIDTQWAAGGVPLWNFYDGAGQPLLADGSSSVFYPGKLLFLFRFLSYPTRYGWYLSLHVLLAAATSYQLAKRLGCNRLGRTTAAISYAFGGSVLFQVNNVIYLVGAAWLPLSLTCVWMTLHSRDWRWPLLGAATCALMLLGGDPQMVYNVGLIAGATLFWSWMSILKSKSSRRELDCRGSWIFSKSIRFVVFVGLTAMLSAIQLFPGFEIARSSKRAATAQAPVNLYGAIGSLEEQGVGPGDWSTIAEGMFGSPKSGTHLSHIYEFSLAPWSLVDLVWPNISGRPFPVNTRWADSFPGADRLWVPSIYMGLLPLVLALCSFRLWGRCRRDVWISRIGFWFLLASFGWYGAIWLGSEFSVWQTLFSRPDSSNSENSWRLGPQVGGLYWLMVVALPKYFWFRYPAKLFVLAALAISILAGRTLSSRLPVQSISFMTVGILVLGMSGCLFSLWLTDWVVPFRDPVFGPLQLSKISGVIILACLHSAVVLALGMFILRSKMRHHLGPAVLTAVFLAVVIIDLVVANRWMLAAVPSAAFESEVVPRYSTRVLWGDTRGQLLVRSGKENRNPYAGSGFSGSASADRVAENIVWQREVLFPKHHLPLRIVHPSSFSSIEMSRSKTSVLNWLDQYYQELSDSLEIRWGTSSFELTFDVLPEDQPVRVPRWKEDNWKIILVSNGSESGRSVAQTMGDENADFYEFPSGSWRVQAWYWPDSFVWGAAVSLAGWTGWLLLMCAAYFRCSKVPREPCVAVLSDD